MKILTTAKEYFQQMNTDNIKDMAKYNWIRDFIREERIEDHVQSSVRLNFHSVFFNENAFFVYHKEFKEFGGTSANYCIRTYIQFPLEKKV